jgi:hypothetical protein
MGGLGLGQQSRAGGTGGLGFEPGPKKLPTKLLIQCKICKFLQEI